MLQISFDELDDDQKNLFLDTAFFLEGWTKEFAMDILNSCGYFPISGIRTLIDKSLISIIDDEELCMHDLLIEMGKEIVRQTFPDEPGKRSRLCMQEDICYVLENLMVRIKYRNLFFIKKIKLQKYHFHLTICTCI